MQECPRIEEAHLVEDSRVDAQVAAISSASLSIAWGDLIVSTKFDSMNGNNAIPFQQINGNHRQVPLKLLELKLANSNEKREIYIAFRQKWRSNRLQVSQLGKIIVEFKVDLRSN